MAKQKRSFLGGLLKFVLVLVIVCGVVYAAAYFTTPNTFKLGDKAMFGSDKTLNEMGLGDMRFTEIAGMAFKLIGNPNESAIVDKEGAPTTESYQKVEEKVPSTSTSTSDSSKPLDYSTLATKPATFEEEKKIDLPDNELAALFNMVLTGKKGEVAGDLSHGSKFVEANLANSTVSPEITKDLVVSMFDQFQVNVESCKTTLDEKTNILEVKTAFSILVPKEFRESLGKLPINLAEKILFKTTNYFKIENQKLVLLQTENDRIIVNNMTVNETNGLLGIVFSNLGIEGYSPSEMAMQYASVVGDVLSTILNNLGDITGVQDGNLQITTRKS